MTIDLRDALGVFGGTFDPIHLAHLAVAEAARDAVGLEQVLFIPAGEPPHKAGRSITAAEHRLAMVRAADRRQSRVRREPDGARSRWAVLHRRHPA